MERTTDSAARDALEALAAEYWETYLVTNPLFATAVGDTRYDDCVPDPTPEGREASAARFEALLARVEALPADAVGGDDAVTHSALRHSLVADIAELRTGLSAWNVDPLDGIPADYLAVPLYQRLETQDDARRMLDRWDEMGRATDLHLDTLRRSLADGRVASVSPTRRTIAILEDLLDAPVDGWPLLDPARDAARLPNWSATERDRFTTALRTVVEERIRPAFIRLHDALVTEILPATRPDTAPGMSAVPGGVEGYRRLIRMHTSLDVDAETLHRIGVEEIGRITGELEALGRAALGAADADATIAALRDDPPLYFATPDEVYETAAASLARAADAAPAWFSRPPRTSCGIARIPAHEAHNEGAGYYRAPAVDGSRQGTFFINTAQPASRPRYEAEALSYHEAIPGHHLQVGLGQELDGLPAFRRHLGPTAYFEGWGMYAERLADEMGLYSGDLDRLGMVSFDAWRAARLVVDTGIHALGWSRRQAIDFMLAHTALSAGTIADEVDRYIALPGQALAYKTGQLELLRLRAEARATMGEAFDIRAFHDTILGGGALPLPTLAAVVAEWASRRLAPA